MNRDMVEMVKIMEKTEKMLGNLGNMIANVEGRVRVLEDGGRQGPVKNYVLKQGIREKIAELEADDQAMAAQALADLLEGE